MSWRNFANSCALVAVFAVIGTGCCVDPLGGRHGGCSGGGCDVPHDLVQDASCGCDGAGCAACDGHVAGPHGPKEHLHSLFRGRGCGDVYWDEWISDPPYCCDPCDDCGNFVGPRSCKPPLKERLHNLWGHRYRDGRAHMMQGHDHGCGCQACLKPHALPVDGEVIYEGPVEGLPVDAAPMTRSTRLAPTPAKRISRQAKSPSEPRKLPYFPKSA